MIVYGLSLLDRTQVVWYHLNSRVGMNKLSWTCITTILQEVLAIQQFGALTTVKKGCLMTWLPPFYSFCIGGWTG